MTTRTTDAADRRYRNWLHREIGDGPGLSDDAFARMMAELDECEDRIAAMPIKTGWRA